MEGSNLRLLHWQVGSVLLSHIGGPQIVIKVEHLPWARAGRAEDTAGVAFTAWSW